MNPNVVVWLGTCEITRKEGKYIKLKDYPYQNIEFTLTAHRIFKEKILRANSNTIIVFLECPYYSAANFNKLKAYNHPLTDNNNNNSGTLVVETVTENKNVMNTQPIDNNNNLVVHKSTAKRKAKITTKFNTKGVRQYPNLIVNTLRNHRRVTAAYKLDQELCSMVDYYNDLLQLLNRVKSPRLSLDVVQSKKGKRPQKTKYSKNWNAYTDGIHPVRVLARLWAYRIIELVAEVEETAEACH